ncbi:YiiD C-terminal domain-containing protein [Kangiella sediminilitoris]|uniref:Thioesterase domain protein n=1 Tax=Kangiella sediminilitoris TaxID=1144748 RepID=A0A1B3BDE6_9GAMM|nr:YiiD C-terminal domain-containing protein [Kangiella sediminilitoris]AOE50832.1 Thioesterase domain protein [Kangiella sediminilitoris]
MNPQQLEALVHREIPITKALEIHIANLTAQSIQVTAPFETNKNIHNTAFAGSIYTVATIAGWSLVNSIAANNQLSGSVVLAKADIQYKKPINGKIVAECSIDDEQLIEQFIRSFQRKNRARINLAIHLNEDSETKAILNANFALVGH